MSSARQVDSILQSAARVVGAGLSRDPHSYRGASRAATKGSIGFQSVVFISGTGKMPVLLF